MNFKEYNDRLTIIREKYGFERQKEVAKTNINKLEERVKNGNLYSK